MRRVQETLIVRVTKTVSIFASINHLDNFAIEAVLLIRRRRFNFISIRRLHKEIAPFSHGVLPFSEPYRRNSL